MQIATTQHLILREFRLEDAEQLFQLNSNDQVLRYVLNPKPWTQSDAHQFISSHDLYERYGFGRWVVTEKENDKLIGWCGLKFKPEFNHVDLGYRFLPQYWGRGYATQAATACLDYGFKELGLKRIVASYIAGNSASLNVMKKLGMKEFGELKVSGKFYPFLEKHSELSSEYFLPEPHIETERLLLRKMHSGDARVLFALNNDAEVVKYTGDKPFSSLENAKEFFRERMAAYERDGYGRWVVVLKQTGETLGWCGLKLEDGETDLGFRFFRRHWRKGFATEAARACIEYGLNDLKLNRIVGRAMHANAASVSVLKKCGMQFIAEKEFLLHAGVEYAIMK